MHMSVLDTAHWQFANTLEDKFQYQWTHIQLIWYTQGINQQNRAWTKNLVDVLDQENQSIEENKSEHWGGKKSGGEEKTPRVWKNWQGVLNVPMPKTRAQHKYDFWKLIITFSM